MNKLIEEESISTDNRPQIAKLVFKVLEQLRDAAPGSSTLLMDEQDPHLIKEVYSLLGEQLKLISEPKPIYDF